MNQAEWLASVDPAAMLASLNLEGSLHGVVRPVSARKLRLWAVACVRAVWPRLTDERSRRAVEVAERYADGEATEAALVAAEAAAFAVMEREDGLAPLGPHYWDAYRCCHPKASKAAEEVAKPAHSIPPAAQAALLRDVVNPFRPLTLPKPKCLKCNGEGQVNGPYINGDYRWPCRECDGTGFGGSCPWLSSTAVALARRAYDSGGERRCERCGGRRKVMTAKGPEVDARTFRPATEPDRPVPFEVTETDCPACHGSGRDGSGRLDAEVLSVLADALEEAGCEDADLLRHLRGFECCPECVAILAPSSGGCWPCRACGAADWAHCVWVPKQGPCVRGCWATDTILGKE